MTQHTSAFSAVIDAIQTVSAAALDPVRVVRGADVSSDPDDVVMVGVAEPPEPGHYTSPGSFIQSMQTFGGGREEVGTVNGLIFARNGDADQGAALDTAIGYFASIEAAVRADKTLGLTAFDYVVTEIESGEVTESKNSMGATAVLSFAIDYKIRL